MKTQTLLLLPFLLVTGCRLLPSPTDDTGSEDTEAPDDTADSGDTADTGGPSFVFATDAPSAYSRVDRDGFPGTASLFISSRDSYNAADPSDDQAGTFATEIVESLSGFHGALDDDFLSAGLAPCSVVGDLTGSCFQQLRPWILPDTLKIDTTAASGFPNGRRLEDPAVDVVLALAWMDLSNHSLHIFASLPLNPPTNDVSFRSEFPYVAPAH